MKNFFRYFNWGLALSTIFAIILVFCFEFIFFKEPEIFAGANSVGRIIYSLLLSYIAAYIFYLLTVYYKEYKSREVIRIPLNKDIEQLLKSYHNLFRTICKSAEIELDNCFSTKEIKKICLLIDTSTPPLNPFSGNNVNLPNNWITYLNIHKNVIKEGVNLILIIYSHNIDYAIIDLLNKIKSCDYFDIINKADQRKTEYKEFIKFFPAMEEYIDMMRNLNELNKKLI